jgi:hypothetical protein
MYANDFFEKASVFDNFYLLLSEGVKPLTKKTVGISIGLLIIFEWALLAKTSPSLPSLPLSLIWILMCFLVFIPLFKDNPLAMLIGRPLNGGFSFLWISIPIFLNFLWGVQTRTLHISHLGTAAALVWFPYLFWHLGNHLKDRVLMDLLLIFSLIIPYKLDALNFAWPLGNGLGGFNAANGILGLHVGISLLPGRFSLVGMPFSQDKKSWIKGGIVILCLLIVGFLLKNRGIHPHNFPVRQSLPLEFLTLAFVYGGIEELFFRGFLMNWLRSFTGSAILSVLIAAGLGGFVSLMPSVYGAALVGITAGLIYLWTSSLLVSTVLSGILRASLVLFYL